MNKKIVFLAAISLMILSALAFAPAVFAAPPTLKRPGELIEANIEGSPIESCDGAWAYDTASGELITQIYETMLTFDGESLDYYLPSLATSWTVENITGTTSPSGLAWYYRYTFTIRPNVKFHGGDWGAAGKYMLTTRDIEYSLEDVLVLDRDGGPSWMLFEPLFDVDTATQLGNLSDPVDVKKVGKMFDESITSDATHVYLNLHFPGAFGPLYQILSQTWSTVKSQGWIKDYAIGSQGRAVWDGEWGDYSTWINFRNPGVDPLDDPTVIMCGTGPYALETYSSAEEYWSVTRFTDYWGGWPASWPAPAYPSISTHVKPAGYVNRFVSTWHYVWETRRDMFLAGDVDFCAVPRNYIDQVLNLPGIRCIYPLPALSLGAGHFTYAIDPLTPFGKINAAGVFTEDGIPADFFGNPTWGINTRKALAASLDYATYLQSAFRGEAIVPATAIIPGLAFYDATVKGYVYNTTEAQRLLHLVPGLWDTGFTLQLVYNTGNTARRIASEMLRDTLNGYNTKFHVSVVSAAWGTVLLPAIVRHQVPFFYIGWLADFADPHNFAVPYYLSTGTFAAAQLYYDPVMEDLVNRGIRESDPAVRKQIYHDIQVKAVTDCVCMPIYQATGRHFERDWMNGWYYNPLYPGNYAYNLWKWYYVPHAKLDTYATAPICNYVPCDVNSDGKVSITDIALVALAFASSFGPPVSTRWNFKCDIDNNRVINIIDIAAVARFYQQTSTTWTPP